jgi:hypothetical protein
MGGRVSETIEQTEAHRINEICIDFNTCSCTLDYLNSLTFRYPSPRALVTANEPATLIIIIK